MSDTPATADTPSASKVAQLKPSGTRRRRALLSVADKTGIVELARGLAELSYEILSTGGTAKALREGGVAVTDVASVTGFPEIMDGRVKTLHPNVHGGLLARSGIDDAVLSKLDRNIAANLTKAGKAEVLRRFE